MPIDPRIALMGNPDRTDVFNAFNTSRAAAQTAQTNQMAMERRAAAQAALQNYMRPPAAAAAPAMQPGSAGPPITGMPLPSVNAMGAGAPMPAAAPVAPVNAALDMSPLYQYLDIPEIKNYVDERNRQETARVTAAGRAVDDARLGDTANQQRVAYTIDRGMPMLARLTRDPSDANLDALAAGFLATPGIDRVYAEQRIAEIRSVPPEARPALIADFMNVDAQGRAARAATFPDVRTINYGKTIGGMPNSDPAALTAPIPERAVTLSPAAQAADERSDEERARQDARDLQRRWDAYDDAVVRHDQWVASAPGASEREQRTQAPRPRPPAEPRPGSNAPAPAAPPAPPAPGGAGSGLPPVGPEGQRVRNRNTNSIYVSRGGRWVPE